eukprot:gene680-6615_t
MAAAGDAAVYDPADIKGVVVKKNDHDVFLHKARFADDREPSGIVVKDGIFFEVIKDDQGREVANDIRFITSNVELPEGSKGRAPPREGKPQEHNQHNRLLPRKILGKVLWFNRRYGIVEDKEGTTALLDLDGIVGGKAPVPGMRFRYKIVEGRNGRPRAVDAVLVEGRRAGGHGYDDDHYKGQKAKGGHGGRKNWAGGQQDTGGNKDVAAPVPP